MSTTEPEAETAGRCIGVTAVSLTGAGWGGTPGHSEGALWLAGHGVV